MKLEQTYYFSNAEFVPGRSWEELEEVYIYYRRLESKDRLQFKEELLYLNKLFQENKHKQIEQWVAEEMYATRLHEIELVQEFIEIMLPIIEKYEYKPEIPYVPLKAFKYMLATYITPKINIWMEFDVWEVQQEGDTYIVHLLKDIDYIEKAFEQNDTLKIEEILKISKDEGVYVLESEYRDEFIQLFKEHVS